jgi:hypothetical protein
MLPSTIALQIGFSTASKQPATSSTGSGGMIDALDQFPCSPSAFGVRLTASGRPLTEASRPRPYRKVNPKFRNPERPSETWAGRGKQPHWVSELLDLAECRARPDAGWIRKSSSFFPDLSWAVSQRGCLPLPAQVSAGWAGFLYFGNTCG